MSNHDQMMGYVTHGDQRVPVPIRDWHALRLALWRSKVAWDIALKAAKEIVEHAAHMEGCPGKTVETEPCLPDCPDRETRLSALVILNAARQFAPIDARRAADQPYYAPSREYFSAVMAELAAAQAELESWRALEVRRPPEKEGAPAHAPKQLPQPEQKAAIPVAICVGCNRQREIVDTSGLCAECRDAQSAKEALEALDQ